MEWLIFPALPEPSQLSYWPTAKPQGMFLSAAASLSFGNSDWKGGGQPIQLLLIEISDRPNDKLQT